MVKHNNAIPHQHFKKKWQINVKTWFNQPARKVRRRQGVFRTLHTRQNTSRCYMPADRAGRGAVQREATRLPKCSPAQQLVPCAQWSRP